MVDVATDDLIERRRLRRRVTLWRLVAIAALVAAAAAFAWRAAPFGDHVARHTVAGVIFEDPARDDLIRAIAEDDSARALVLRIDSPGGSVAGSESLYAAIRAVAERKPVVAVMGEVAASGGYIAALAADRIVARGGTVTGSIGVVAEFPNIQGLLDDLGVGVDRVASAPLKAEPSPLREPSEAALAAQAAVVDDAYAWFLDLVAERRDMTPERAREVGDGRVFSGRQALAVGLVDQIGGETEALDWLTLAHGLPAGLRVRDREVGLEPETLLDLVGGAALGEALAGWGAGPRPMAIMR
jgi:protease-4